MRVLIDMNLSPAWVGLFQNAGIAAIHWSDVGAVTAKDFLIMEWARDHQCVVFTHDLDFGAILHAARASAPSVIQLRHEDTHPIRMAPFVIPVVLSFHEDLKVGCLLTIHPRRNRVQLLPFRKSP